VYHTLIRDFVPPPTMLDRQVATAYELRNFRDYYDVTDRILRALRAQWGAQPQQDARLLSEMDRTLAFIEWRRLPWICRIFRRKPR
jgi:hypothetical protein